MYNKTTSSNFLRFGKISNSFKTNPDLVCETFTATADYVDTLSKFNDSAYIELIEGMALLRIANDPDYDTIQTFAIHRNIRINKNNYFSVIPMTGTIKYNLYYPKNAKVSYYKLENPYPFKRIVQGVQIKEILAYYYVVKSPNYVFPGEKHNFFEFTYVDHGSLETQVDGETLSLGVNQCLIYVPGQFHDQKITSDESCSYLTVVFDGTGIDTSLLKTRVFDCSRNILSIVDGFVKATDSTLPFKYDSMITLLQTLVIQLLQTDARSKQIKPTTPINQHFEDKLLEEIVSYINQHLFEPLPIEQICSEFSISRSSLQNLFKENMQIAPKQYINEAKLSRSRVLIRKSEHTISEISNMLGFNSIHYFSRKFTQRYGITPSEYSKKIYDQDDHSN